MGSDRRTILAAVAGMLLFVSGRGEAWDIKDSDVHKRFHELDAAWEGKNEEAIRADKLKRAKQSKPPDWLEKAGWDASKKVSIGDAIRKDSGWGVDVEGRQAAFAVGIKSEAGKSPLAVDAAEDRARAKIAKLTAPQSSGRLMSATVQSRPLDWYVSKSGDLFALVFGTAEPAR